MPVTDQSFRSLARSAAEAVETSLAAVTRSEPLVKAWAFLDPERARREAAAVDSGTHLPLSGLVAGVKDVFATSDMPTEYGSRLYAGFQPRADAGAVALLRAGGAVVLGKTVTAELAHARPGPTTNPHRPTHTPGGSSMGSAAAVACGMADIALGTQTAGSVLRPASFCGIYGFKPTFGSVTTSGVKVLAPSLDTVGWFARDPSLLDAVRCQLTGRRAAPALSTSPTIGLLRTEQWDQCSVDARRAVEWAADIAQALGARVVELEMPKAMDGLAGRHWVVMAYEASKSLAWEHLHHRAELSTEMLGLLDFGQKVSPDELDSVQEQRQEARAECTALFATCDAVLTPVVPGEAPAGLSGTGDPRFTRLWTMLGLPATSIPATVGGSGLPVGVQLVGGSGDDARLLAITRWLSGEKVVLPAGSAPPQGVLA